MWVSIVTLLAVANLALAAPPAAATYCSEDNLLRAFQHTPTPAAVYCSKPGTTYPSFLNPKTYATTRFSSACSCFSRFPSESTKSSTSTTTTSGPTATAPVCFQLRGSSTVESGSRPLNIIVTADPTKPCGTNGIAVSKVCGSYSDNSLFLSDDDFGADNCYYPGTVAGVSSRGIPVIIASNTGATTEGRIFYDGTSIEVFDGYYTPAFMSVACPANFCP